ncbi:MAG: quinoprotein dehydrogenase-associated putative ABC transporter substrate-binding protein [Betaproteobacteria bacterium]|nr:quinoprotein dehydrogenase-associated putative ABC transporter substrate-binding protein [Betaproteobacteria bacterium]MBA3776087.1 quinoprotein dehydrogenase-associated putative ABC transporter substrate-binding protein [Betaproteobacteria bacterium]
MNDGRVERALQSSSVALKHASSIARLRLLTSLAVVLAIGIRSGIVCAQETRTAFRPCIDPSNLPFANDKGEGFENRIAELFAGKLGLPMQSYAFPQRMGFIRNTLRYKLPGQDFRCDIVMSVPAGYDQASATAAYYRSTYVLVYPKGKGLDQVKTGSDLIALPVDFRNKLTIGIYDKSPASAWLAKHGMEAQAKPYQMLSPDPEQYPGSIIDKDLAQGKIDAAIVWGPIAGYYAKRVTNVGLTVIPLKSEPGVKFDYEIAMGVRFGEREWKATVEKLIAENRAPITAILREYGVPLVNERGELIE